MGLELELRDKHSAYTRGAGRFCDGSRRVMVIAWNLLAWMNLWTFKDGGVVEFFRSL
jgi:hypothetical protein